MEPEDLLNSTGDELPPGPDELRAIVAKAKRRWWGLIVGPLAVALAGGLGIGYAVSNHGASHAQNVATESPAASGNAATSAGVSSSSQSSSPAYVGSSEGTAKFTPLFTRTVGDIDIRGFEIPGPKLPVPAAPPQCTITIGPRFEAEVSTPKMVGVASSGFFYLGGASPSTSALSDVQASVLGVAEGEPVVVITAQVGRNVASVRETGFSGGASDEMAPVQGWVALAGPTAAPSAAAPQKAVKLGTITALDASGKVLATQTVTNTSFGFYGGPLTGSASASEGVACPAQPPPCSMLKQAYASNATAPLPATVCGNPGTAPCSTNRGTSGAPSVQYACPMKPVPGASTGSTGAGTASGGSVTPNN